jgi:hypothetical protein
MSKVIVGVLLGAAATAAWMWPNAELRLRVTTLQNACTMVGTDRYADDLGRAPEFAI